MKKIKTFNLVTGEKGVCPIDEYFFNNLKIEINSCKRTIEDHPDIGTVKDGSIFAMQKTIEALEKKAKRLSSSELIFTTFYEDILDDIEAIKAICNDNDEIPINCVLMGQELGYAYVRSLIKKLNDTEGAEE